MLALAPVLASRLAAAILRRFDRSASTSTSTSNHDGAVLTLIGCNLGVGSLQLCLQLVYLALVLMIHTHNDQ